MPRVGVPAPFRLVAAYLVGALVCWLAASVALLLGADELAAGLVASPDVLLAVHLLGLGFLPLAVAGAALHVLPTFLRASPDARLGWAGLVLLAAGPFLAVGIARDAHVLARACAVLVAVGLAVLALQLALLLVRSPRGKLPLASRFGVGASALHAVLAFAVGRLLLSTGWRPALGVPHERLIAIHLHLAAIGWLTLLIVTVGRALAPMLALAPAEPLRRVPGAEIVLTGGVWIGVAGFWVGSRAFVAAGAAILVAGLARFVALVVRAARLRRTEAMEGPIAHFLAGLLFLAQAGALAVALLAGTPRPRPLAAYAILLLAGWAAGITIGHAGKLLSLSAWTSWPPGPRPKQAFFYDGRVWIAEAAAFAAGIEALAAGVLLGSAGLARVGASLLLCSAAAAFAGAVVTLRRST